MSTTARCGLDSFPSVCALVLLREFCEGFEDSCTGFHSSTCQAQLGIDFDPTLL